MRVFIDGLALDETEKARLRELTPRTYTGNAAAQAANVRKYISEM